MAALRDLEEWADDAAFWDRFAELARRGRVYREIDRISVLPEEDAAAFHAARRCAVELRLPIVPRVRWVRRADPIEIREGPLSILPGASGGWMVPANPGTIWLVAGQGVGAITAMVAHELRHCWQSWDAANVDRSREDLEADAVRYASRSG